MLGAERGRERVGLGLHSYFLQNGISDEICILKNEKLEFTVKMEKSPVFGFVYIRARRDEIPSVQDMMLVAIGIKFIPLLSVC
jgi:hypothetical protein